MRAVRRPARLERSGGSTPDLASDNALRRSTGAWCSDRIALGLSVANFPPRLRGLRHHENKLVTKCPSGRGGIRREGASEAAPEAVRQAIGGGCQSGWGAVTVGYKCH